MESAIEEKSVVKPEYVVKDHARTVSLECLSEGDRKKLLESAQGEDEPEKKRRKFDRGKLKGQNKDRPRAFRESKESQFCPLLIDSSAGWKKCPHENCPYQHDAKLYMSNKPEDIAGTCYVYSVRGHCPRGITCRFGAEHLTAEGENLVDEDVFSAWKKDPENKTVNTLDKELQVSLWKRTYNFDRSEKVIKSVDRENGKAKDSQAETTRTEESLQQGRPKKEIDWRGKLYLAPLTTVGNLPFRRICVEYGADVTCGEMAMAKNLLQGQKAEWALVRRHASEKIFGVQVCGNNQYIMTRCAQLLEEKASIDFIDVNLGCPLDFIHDQGSGSGLLRRERVLMNIVECMNRVVNIPLTVKTRTGLALGKNIVHNFMPSFHNSGVSLITVHGRTRDQRYSKSADWEYIEECAKGASPTPVFGNGDILSHEDYSRFMENSPSVSGVMIGRGALIKPWIFTEIKEKRGIDVTSGERFDMLRRYTNYGLEHWGSDTRGVETTRRFLLEWLSFLYRYIPYGLLQDPPQTMNTRPPHYKGRNDLETLMASPACSDWIKISEMLLGPVPPGFAFLPKHKASAWK